MRDNLTKIKDIARDVERGNRNMKALVYCVIALVKEVEHLKKAEELERAAAELLGIHNER